MKNTVRNFCVAAAGVGAVAILAAQAPPAPQQPPPPAAESEIRTTIRGEPGAPPHYAVPDFIALTNDKETADAAKLIARGAVGRSGVRARVRHDSARHLQAPSSRRRRPTRSRSIAGASLAPTASSRARSGAPATRSRSRCACSTCAARGVALGRVYDNVSLQKSARRRAHDFGRHPSDAERICAASRGRSSRSSPIATTSASSTRSRRATAKRSMSPTTTARTRCG